jgi:hypothetical protein
VLHGPRESYVVDDDDDDHDAGKNKESSPTPPPPPPPSPPSLIRSISLPGANALSGDDRNIFSLSLSLNLRSHIAKEPNGSGINGFTRDLRSSDAVSFTAFLRTHNLSVRIRFVA